MKIDAVLDAIKAYEPFADEDELSTVIEDLITDALHVASHNGWDAELVARRAVSMYFQELELPNCDACKRWQEDTLDMEWNGETGRHVECEREVAAGLVTLTLDND